MSKPICFNYEEFERLKEENERLRKMLDCSEIPNGSDLISRQAAIECCSCLHPEDCWAEIKALPSAEPLVLTCDGCRHVGTYDTDFPCSGCIRREKDYYEKER